MQSGGHKVSKPENFPSKFYSVAVLMYGNNLRSINITLYSCSLKSSEFNSGFYREIGNANWFSQLCLERKAL